jgi:hypothetical protein
MAVKYGALLTQIQLDLEMELYLRTEFTQISLVKNYIIVVLIVHKHFVVKEIFLDIQVGSNSGEYFL